MLGRRRSGKQISLVPRQPEHVEIIYDWFDFTDFYPNWEPPSFGQYMERYEKRAGDNDCTLWSVIRNAEEADDELDDDGEIDGEVVGITELWDFTSSRGCLESLVYIVPGARGQGYGTQVVELRAAYAFESLLCKNAEDRD